MGENWTQSPFVYRAYNGLSESPQQHATAEIPVVDLIVRLAHVAVINEYNVRRIRTLGRSS